MFHCFSHLRWWHKCNPARVSLFTRLFFCSLSRCFSAKPHTLWCYYHRVTLPPLLTSTVDTTHCNVVSNVCHKTNQFILCDIGIQNSPSLGSIGGDVDEVEINATSLAQCPGQSHIHCSTSISREVNAGEGGDRGWTWRDEWLGVSLNEATIIMHKVNGTRK